MTFGIIGAMESEVEYLKDAMEDAHAVRVSGMEFYEGTLAGKKAVVVKCGVGKVNAAACAQTAIMMFGATHVINTGVAGSLDASIDIGDLVISTDVVHHDMDATPIGFAPGEVPDMGKVAFEADEGMRALVRKAAAEAGLEIGVFDGRVASGDQFVAAEETKERIVSTFGARCCEMEGAPIGHVCYLNNVPFVVVRAISDKADGSSHMDYPAFEAQAARNCALIVEKMVELSD